LSLWRSKALCSDPDPHSIMAAREEGGVSGMGEAMKQAEEGMKLFQQDEDAELDTAAATAFKEDADKQIAALEEEAKGLTGKDNKKARTEKEKAARELKNTKEYIDATKVLKGSQPPNGNFLIKKAAAKAAPAKEEKKEEAKDDKKEKEKKEKPKKEQESAGISREEKAELEKLKDQIIERKKKLKEEGMSGGQMNKDAEIVGWVTRMQELKEKESPGSTTATKKDEKKKSGKKLDSVQMAALEEKEKAYEAYLDKLKTEFKYSKKEIAADPDAIDMKKEIDALKK